MMIAKEISRQLVLRVEDVTRYLLPNGKKQGHEWCVGSISGESGSSLKVRLSGDKAGIWSDFATGESGDLLDLWAMKNGISISQALRETCEYLGIKQQRFEGHKPRTFSKPKVQKVNLLPQSSTAMTYLTEERALTTETLNAYQISQAGDEIVIPYVRDGEIVFMKYLSLERSKGKKKVRVEPNCEPCLFGWHLISNKARSVTLCEGEIDAMSLHQLGIAALSVPFGAGTGNKHEWIEYEFERLSVFDEIFICMDSDEEGKKAAKEIIDNPSSTFFGVEKR